MTRRSPAVTLLLAAVFFGIAPTGTKYALGGFGPVTAMLVELLAATVVLWIAVLRRGYRRLLDRRRVIVLGLLEPGLAYLLFSLGLKLTTASNAALMSGLECGFVVVLAALFLHERAGWSVIAGVLLAVVGLVVLEGGAGDLGAPGFGDLLMAAGALSAALYTIVARGLAPEEDPLSVTAHQFAIATAVVLPLAGSSWSTGTEALPVGVPLRFWLVAAVVGVLGFAAAFLLYNCAITAIDAGPAAVIINLAPAFGLASAVLWLGEALTPQRGVGAALITLSVGLFVAVEKANQLARGRPGIIAGPDDPEP